MSDEGVQHANTEAARIEAGTGADSASNETTQRALAILLGKDNEGISDDLQSEENDEGVGKGANGVDSKGSKKPIKTIADAAERLGLKIEDLYKLEVSIADGQDSEKFSVGALKDAMKDRSDFKFQQLRWGEDKAEQEGELLRSRNEIVELLAMMPKEAIKPEVISKIREKHDATLKLERERTLNVIKEWRDEKVRGADIDAMREHLTRAGFPANYLGQISDHRTMRYIRENMLREQRIQQALAMVKPKQPKGQAPSQRGNSMRSASQPTAQQRGNTGESQRIQAVKNLLLNKG
jgi:hypothetical protein